MNEPRLAGQSGAEAPHSQIPCRHYYTINPAATAEYVYAYREMWDNETDDQTPEKKI